MNERDQCWSRCIALADVPEEGLHVAIEADSGVRTTLARTANLRDLPHLEASFDLRRNASRLHVTGEVTATVGQNCVVTLDPVEQNLHESIDLVFAPGPAGTLGDSEASITMSDSAPEPLVGGTVDLGAIATEYFLLGIDPYPRKEGAVFEAATGAGRPESPFAALEALRTPAAPPEPPKKPPLGRK
jgi:uncharacterized metal-binding protein YceD (DUF177 family)